MSETTSTLPEVARVAGDTRRDRDAAHHFAQLLGRLGRALSAIEAGRWDTAHDHLSWAGEEAAIFNVILNTGRPDPRTFLDAVRGQVPQEWATAICRAVGDRRD